MFKERTWHLDVLEKLVPKYSQPWLCCPQKATQSLGMGVRAEKKLPEAILIPEGGNSPG